MVSLVYFWSILLVCFSGIPALTLALSRRIKPVPLVDEIRTACASQADREPERAQIGA